MAYKLEDLPFQPFSATDDTREPVKTNLKGQIPEWLHGSLYRSGPGLYKIGDTMMNHLFDGMAVIHKFQIKNGEVFYRNLLLDSSNYVMSVKANRLMATQFATVRVPDPCANMFGRFFSHFTDAVSENDNTCVNVVQHGDQLYAMTESPKMNLIDSGNLTVIKKVELDKVIPTRVATAHPHFDTSGNMFNLATRFQPNKASLIVKIPLDKEGKQSNVDEAEVVAMWPFRSPTNAVYNHSFGMSLNYLIVLDQPMLINLFKLFSVRYGFNSFASVMNWVEGQKTIFTLINRENGTQVSTTFTADGFFCFHFVNCYEEEGHLVVDLCAFKDGSIVKDLYLDNIIRRKCVIDDNVTLRRYVLPLDVSESKTGENLVRLTGTKATAVKQPDGSIYCSPDMVVDDPKGVSMELPRINYAYNAKKYKYSYGTTFQSLETLEKIIKVDMEARTTKTWTAGTDECAGEPVFVAKPDASDEDDGVILSPIVSLNPEKPSYLLILDAKTFTEIARAETTADVKMPFSFHGSFVENL